MRVQTQDTEARARRVRELIDEVVATQPDPEPFKGFLDLADVLLEVELDGVRCILHGHRPRPHVPGTRRDERGENRDR